MTNKFKKHDTVFTQRDIDMTPTGGPFIPKGSQGLILIRRRDGRVWVNMYRPDFGRMHLHPSDMSF